MSERTINTLNKKKKEEEISGFKLKLQILIWKQATMWGVLDILFLRKEKKT